MPLSPNMLLNLPTPEVTIGPTWASNLNTALELVDAHDHSTGKGVKVTPAGMNINATLEINSQDVTEVNSLSLDTRASAPSTLRALYSKSGDLYFRNTAGTEVQVTNGSAIAGTPGSITNLGAGGSSAIFSDINEDFTWYFNGVKLAAQNTGDVRLYPFDGVNAYTFAVTLKSPTTLAANYSLTLPGTAPAQSGVWSVSTAGVVTNGLHDGTASAPSVYFTSDTNLGLYRVGADQLGVIGQLQVPAGSATTPTYSFVGAATTGLYTAGGAIQLSTAGVRRGLIDSGGLRLDMNGGLATPSFSWDADPDTGIFRGGVDNIGISAGGVSVFNANTAGMDSAIPYRGPAASAAAPTWSFSGDSNTGVYSDAADTLKFAAGGFQRAAIDGTGFGLNVDGALATPSLFWSADPNTGIFRGGVDNIGISAGGVSVFNASTSAMDSAVVYRGPAGSAAAPTWSFNGDSDTGVYNYGGAGSNAVGVTTAGAVRAIVNSDGITTSGRVMTDNRGAAEGIKWAVFANSLAAGSAVDLNVGGTSTILGAVGMTTVGGTANYQAMQHETGATANRVVFNDSVSVADPFISIQNVGATANSYRVVVYYQ